VVVRFVDIGVIVDHHCLEVVVRFVRFVDMGVIVDHHCLYLIVRVTQKNKREKDLF
jgi:hypothetical protein